MTKKFRVMKGSNNLEWITKLKKMGWGDTRYKKLFLLQIFVTVTKFCNECLLPPKRLKKTKSRLSAFNFKFLIQFCTDFKTLFSICQKCSPFFHKIFYFMLFPDIRPVFKPHIQNQHSRFTKNKCFTRKFRKKSCKILKK